MKSKRYYYQFWLKSSRGTNEVIMRMYWSPPTDEQLKLDVEDWCARFCAWTTSENVCSYGWKPITRLPKNRKQCLAQYEKICKEKQKWNDKFRLYCGLLQYPPFNGQK